MKKLMLIIVFACLAAGKLSAQEHKPAETKTSARTDTDSDINGDPDPEASKDWANTAPPGKYDHKPLPKAIYYQDAAKYKGRLVTFTAKVYSHKTVDTTIMVRIDPDASSKILTLRLKGAAKTKAKEIDGKVVLVDGIVTESKGKLEVVVSDPDLFSVLW